MVGGVVDEMSGAGLPVRMQTTAPIRYKCRPAALKRAVRNLLDNAVKYGKTASAELHVAAQSIEIDILDSGAGIPEVELARVLEPFYRLEGSRSRETGGVGLGLAIAQTIAQAHGGKVKLQNRPVGGLRASIVLPRATS
jgi:signal transduction histidine kinase